MQRSWTIVCLAVACGLGLALAGCGARASSPPAAGAVPTRIVSLAPSATEMLFGLGAGDRVVGVTDYCRHPPEARTRAHIGGYMTPSLERILGLRPDLVCYFPSILPDDAAFAEGLAAAGIPALPLAMGDIPAVFTTLERLADRVGCADAAPSLIARLRADLAAAEAEFADRPRRRVLVAVSGDPHQCFVAGRDTFVAELLGRARGENAANGRPGYYVLSAEALLAADPDVIVDASRVHETPADARTAADSAWAQLDALRAVREHRVRSLSDDAVIQPGLRLAQGLRALGTAIHDAEGPR